MSHSLTRGCENRQQLDVISKIEIMG